MTQPLNVQCLPPLFRAIERDRLKSHALSILRHANADTCPRRRTRAKERPVDRVNAREEAHLGDEERDGGDRSERERVLGESR